MTAAGPDPPPALTPVSSMNLARTCCTEGEPVAFDDPTPDVLPLTGLSVVDLSQGGVGPWAGLILSHLGADVIKIEPPRGDWIRRMRPQREGVSLVYATNNHLKTVRYLDYKQLQDRESLTELLTSADVLLENFRPGVLDRNDLGYERLAEIAPRLVYCSATGFGNKGPGSTWPSTDPHMQAFGGLAHRNGEFLRWFGCLDRITALALVQCALLGLTLRQRTGHGAKMETSMLAASLWAQASAPRSAKEPPTEAAVFPSADRWFVACTRTSSEQRRLNELLDGESSIRQRPAQWWVKRLAERGIVSAPLMDTHEVTTHHNSATNQLFGNIAKGPWQGARVGSFPLSFAQTKRWQR